MMKISEAKLYELLGERIRKRRQALSPHLTQTMLADALNLERTSISNIENGNQRPPLHVLYKLCAFLRVDVAQLLPDRADIEIPEDEPAEQEEVTVGGKSELVPPKTSAFIQRTATKSTALPGKTAAFVAKHRRPSGERNATYRDSD